MAASGDVASLGNPTWASNFLPSSLGAVTFGGQLYGVPIRAPSQFYFFYNKPIFSKLGLTFPTTFSGLLSTVATLKSHGYSPISLANGDQWPGLMYLEYLTDRIGGPSVAQDIVLGKPNASSNPAIVKALTDIPAAGQGRGVPERLRLAALQRGRLGRTGVQRRGGHAADGRLGRIPDARPEQVLRDRREPRPGLVPLGRGRHRRPPTWPGNTASYVAISSKASAAQKAVAEAFMRDVLASSSYAKASVSAGEPFRRYQTNEHTTRDYTFMGPPAAAVDVAATTAICHSPAQILSAAAQSMRRGHHQDLFQRRNAFARTVERNHAQRAHALADGHLTQFARVGGR